ncbi:MAG: NAD(P)(+) transhydrogenase (Re/Si-specific) subunit alpha, partial [Saprospiraceae bacterium]
MKIGVLKERKAFENRVALTPAVVKDLIKKGFEVMIETDAGTLSSFSDEEYIQSGANIATSAALAADNQVVLKVNAFTEEEVLYINPGTVLISFMYAYTIPQLLVKLNEKRISSFSMDAVPRISRAQKMDALSSQANLAGYKAVMLGANYLNKIFPLLMTAAGTITPAKVLIFGAGVAGLQAIATAKRLGAVVEVTDVR